MWRSLLWLALVGVGVLLLLLLAYFARGSLELYPTEEQHAKVRLVTGSLAALLAVVELGLWWLLRRLGRASRYPRRLTWRCS